MLGAFVPHEWKRLSKESIIFLLTLLLSFNLLLVPCAHACRLFLLSSREINFVYILFVSFCSSIRFSYLNLHEAIKVV